MERIFRQLEPLLSSHLSVQTWSAEYSKFSPRELLKNIRAAGKCRADVYHVTGDIHYIVWGLPRRRTLLTIHDCVFLYNSSGLKRKLLKWILLDMPVRRSRLITTISEATKKDILTHTNCPAEKLVVIPDPVNDTIYHSPLNFREQKPVILFVGTTLNKNLLRVAQALENISCQLTIIGKLSDEQRQALTGRHIEFTLHMDLTDEEMAENYAQADMVLFPSTFEGFGLPVIEGQKAGRPVITSNLEPMKETAGDGACLVDPYDIGSIREGVLRVIRDKPYREQLVRKGLDNVERFAPENIARAYLSCYNKLLNS